MWILFSLLSALFFALWQVTQKKIFFRENILDFMLVQNAIVFSIFLFFIFKINLNIPYFIMFLIFIAALIGFSSTLMLFRAIQKSELSSIAPLMNLTSLFVIFIAFFFLREIPSIIQIIGIITIVIGTYLLAVKSYKQLFTFYWFAKPKYIIYTIITAFAWAFVGVIARYSMNHISIYSYLFYFEFFALICAVFLSVITKRITNFFIVFKRSGKAISLAAILIIISDVLILIALSFPVGLVALVIPIRRVSTFFSALIGGTFFKEKNIVHKLAACLIMLAGVFIIAFN